MLKLRSNKKPNDFKSELMTAETLHEFLEICGKHYDLENCKLNNFQLSAMVGNIDKLITVSGAKPKK